MKKMKKLLIIVSASVFFCMVAFAESAQADAGVPMLLLMWPAMVLLMWPVALLVLVAIVLLEAEIGHRMLPMNYRRWLSVSATANLASTLIGIPVTYVLGYGMMEILDLFYRSARETFESQPNWIIPVTVLILCTPVFYLTSVGIEYLVACQIVTKEQHSHMRTWSWRANTGSYGVLTLLLLVLLFAMHLSSGFKN